MTTIPDSEQEPPRGADLNRPSVARVYDYYLGGTANWAIDREFGDQVLGRFPLLRDIAISNRLFLNRAVRHLTKLGIRQFLDIGAGVPTAGNTHQVADELALHEGREPDARVVYVDNEPIAVAHAEQLLNKEGDALRHEVIHADLRNPEALWRDALATDVLDPNEPIALLLIAVLHVAQPDEKTGVEVGPEAVARLREFLPSGSYLALSHITDDGVPDEVQGKLVELKEMYDQGSSSNVIWRSRPDVQALLGDFEVVEPGWTWTPRWHPEETGPTAKQIDFKTPAHAVIWAGVGRKP